MLPEGAHPSSDRLERGGYLSFAGAKVQLFHILAKHSGIFLRVSRVFMQYTLYIIYAREKGRGEREGGGGRKGKTGVR